MVASLYSLVVVQQGRTRTVVLPWLAPLPPVLRWFQPDSSSRPSSVLWPFGAKLQSVRRESARRRWAPEKVFPAKRGELQLKRETRRTFSARRKISPLLFPTAAAWNRATPASRWLSRG